MKQVKLDQLQPIDELSTAMLHKSGSILIEEGDILTQPMIDYMKELTIDNVFFLSEDESYASVRREMTHISVSLDSLKEGEKLLRAIYDPKGQLL
ncbi:MAG: hypothetical protein ACYTFY_06890, partial [Planctomycetota bacterium]